PHFRRSRNGKLLAKGETRVVDSLGREDRYYWGKEATTYWRFFNAFSERFPKVQLNQDKHLTDADNLYCAGGTTSACDLYIYLIERFCGANI
ncbi:hypothetical protein Q6276_28140, partial [Klebsiella variicola]|nr:hypothetical protein [Klebsiella variicola]